MRFAYNIISYNYIKISRLFSVYGSKNNLI